MRLPKTTQNGSCFSVKATKECAYPDADEQRHFRALFYESAASADSPWPGSNEQEGSRQRATPSSSRADVRESADCENGMPEFDASGRFDLDELKVRLTNGPLAGWEIEACRCGGLVSIRVRASSLALGNTPPPTPAALARDLSAQLGLPVSVEYCDAPAPSA
jgi:hypothetical protein